jgi:PAS domain S-box-containing protein
MELSKKIALIVFAGVVLSTIWTVFMVLPAVSALMSVLALTHQFGYYGQVALQALFIYLFSIVPISVIVWVVVRRMVVNPIIHINETAKIIASGNLGKRVDIVSNDEIGQLGASLNAMVGNLASAFQNMANSLGEVTKKEVELRKNFKALAESKAQDEALLTSIGDGVIATDHEGKIIFTNKETEQMLGWKTEEMIGSIWDQVVTAMEERSESLDQVKHTTIQTVLKGGSKAKIDCFLAKRDGTKFPVAVTVSPIINAGVIFGMIILFRDITKEKEVDRMKTEFISLASHQLRTPLSAIRWFAELMLDGTSGQLSSEQHELAQNISLSAERMVELVNSLLNISRIESGRIIIDPQPTDLVQLAQEVIKDVEAKYKEKNQKVVISAHEALPKISIDPRLVRQVYMNLLTNAIKYSPQGTDIIIFISRKGEEIISQVSDSGYGIPKKDQGKLFQKFFRAENIIKVETDGTGLGLYLVKAIIESSKGRIWFSSEEGKGTTFWFSLPVAGTPARKGEVSLDS